MYVIDEKEQINTDIMNKDTDAMNKNTDARKNTLEIHFMLTFILFFLIPHVTCIKQSLNRPTYIYIYILSRYYIILSQHSAYMKYA